MFKNKFALKLSGYFAIVIISFAVIMGTLFLILFKDYTTHIYKEDLSKRATSIANTISEYVSSDSEKGRMKGYGAFFMWMDKIANTNVWVVDENLELFNTGKNNHNEQYQYSDLPNNAEKVVKSVFEDKKVFSEDFSDFFGENTITVGVPIKQDGKIIGAVLLHSPYSGMSEAVTHGIQLLIISLLVALVISFILSIWLSKEFTNPILSKEAQDAIRMEKIRRDFVANISHELKTPISVIKSSLEAITEKVVVEPEKVESFNKQMLNETKFLERLVADLLDLSKLQNDEFILNKESVLIVDVIEDVVLSMTQIANKKQISITVENQNKKLFIDGDYQRIRQLFIIILDNALKFSPIGESVNIKIKDENISILDKGIGIPASEMDHIFERFYKNRDESNKIGTGLGLAIAKQIADRHSIDLTIESKEKQGTTVYMKLPSK